MKRLEIEGLPRVQVAPQAQEGDPADPDFLCREDVLSHYHIDGRGKLLNEIGLIVGVALSRPPAAGNAWGAFTCHPGTHRSSVA